MYSLPKIMVDTLQGIHTQRTLIQPTFQIYFVNFNYEMTNRFI